MVESDDYMNCNGTGSLLEKYPPELLQFAAVCCIVFIVLGIPGNILTIIALLKSPKLRNATTAFIVNLCFADGFFCASSLPFMTSLFLHKRWDYGHEFCALFPMFRYTNVAVSLLTVVAITVNRYVNIVHPLKYPIIFRKWTIALMIGFLWVASIGLLFPPLIQVWGKFGFDCKVGTCSILSVNGRSPKTFLYIVAFALPSVSFLLCYGRIYWIVRKAQQKTGWSSSRPTNKACCFPMRGRYDSNNAQPQSANSKSSSTSKDMRLLRMILVIFCTFAVCFLPVAVVKIFRKEDDLPVVNVFGYLGVFVTACVNPCIYVTMSKEYRRAYKQLFICCFGDTIISVST